MQAEEKARLWMKCHRGILRQSIRRARRHADWKRVCHALLDPFFPVSYLLRNMVILERETPWKRLTHRGKVQAMHSLLRERALFFLQVKTWLKTSGGYKTIVDFSPPFAGRGTPSYCTHCGGCCETASGFPDFPSHSIIPQRWKEIFSSGLGKGHRFCPFLWEYRKTGMSLCAIHPWRANPCRVFGEDDCTFVLQDPDLAHVTHEKHIGKAFKTLIQGIKASPF